MTAEGTARRRRRWLRVAGGLAGAQILAVGILLFRVPWALPEPVVLEIDSVSINAHGDPRWVVLQDENALRILDPTSLQVTATVDTGASPLHGGVAVRPGTGEGLALSGNAVVRVDLAAGSVIGSTPLAFPDGLRSTPDVLGVDERGTRLLIGTAGGVSALDLTSGDMASTSIYAGVVSSRGRLWGADDATLDDVEYRYLGNSAARVVALSPDEERFYVFSDAPAAVVVDTRTNEVDTISGNRRIYSKVVLPTADGRHVVTIGGQNSTQVLVRGLDGTDVVAVQTEAPIEDMDISSDGSTVYATTGTQLLVVDMRAYT